MPRKKRKKRRKRPSERDRFSWGPGDIEIIKKGRKRRKKKRKK